MLGILRILLIQLVILVALAGAAVGYLNWSSEMEWAEFVNATATATPDAKAHPRSEPPLQAVKAPAGPRSENVSERVGTCRGRAAGHDG
jgi:flagellar basal body-associated protein FliL